MATSVSTVARFERADRASGRELASAGNDWNFKEVLRMDHLNFEGPTQELVLRFIKNVSAVIEVLSRIRPVQRETPRGSFRRGVLSQYMLNLRSARGAKVDLALGQRGQLFVSDPFLIEGLLQDTGAIVAAKLLRPRDQAAVARDLIMLGGLGGVDQCRIQHRFVLDLTDDLVGFLDDAVDRRTVDCLHFGAMHLEHLLKALQMGFGFHRDGSENPA